MRDIPDRELLEQFTLSKSEEAFAELVRRHIALVHSVALRHTDSPQHAQEITQAVFIILARKAASLGRKTVLSGWLYQTARLTAANFRRAEFRRVRREQEAFMQSTLEETPSDTMWRELAPLLEEAMARLGATDRDAVVLRYFENKSLQEVGAVLGMEERAAQKRVLRAVEKLRAFFARRGVALTTTIIAGAVSANSVQAAPIGLATTVVATAVKGSAVAASTLTLIKGALKLMAWTKVKAVAATSAVVLLAAGTATVAVKTVYAQTQPDIQGSWEGIVNTQLGAKLRVVLKVTKENGSYRATADSIDQRVKDIPVNKFNYNHPAVQFEMDSVGGTFDGTLNPADTEMSGTWKQPNFGLVAPLVLKRTATPSTIPALLAESDYAPRAGSDLQGYWKGAVKIGTGSLTVAFKFSEPAGGTLLAEMDSPDQGANNLVVSTVTYDKPTVRLEVGSAGGVFEGDVGNGGTEIKGTWSQMGTTLPLTVKRADPRAERAQVAALAAKKDYSYTSPDDLTGHWKGALDIKGMKLHLALHVAKLPNGNLAGTLDSIDQGAKDIPANVVRFTAPNAHLEWPTIAGTYEGKLENGKLSGTWRQGAGSFPLLFERSTAE